LKEFLATGYPVANVHLIGHSLGGQLVGVIGRSLIKESAGVYRLPRITALDPAKPDFYPPSSRSFSAISSADADFVDVIHTNGGFGGAGVSTGTVDFYPNSGMLIQPGCGQFNINIFAFKMNRCSHYRSWLYYAESVTRPISFLAVKAKNWDAFKKGNVDVKNYAFMGYAASTDLRGDYFLQTNDKSLYGKGEAGVMYH